MKKITLMLPLVLLASCCGGPGPVEYMTCLINESTEAINCNRMAIEEDTAAICENIRVTVASTETIAENHRQLESMKE